MDAIKIVRCSPRDWQVVQALGLATFTDTYEHKNSPENFRNYVSQAFSAAQIQSELAHSYSYFFLAKTDGRTVGYLKLNELEAQTEAMGDYALEIERIYVAAEAKGRGIGHQLIAFAEQTARSLGKSMLWLGVWVENPDAIAFYEKMGFKKFGSHIFTVGDDEQEDFLFQKNLGA